MLPSPTDVDPRRLMTDLPSQPTSVPSRLGVSGRYEDDVFTMALTPAPETLCHGIVRASVLTFLIDAISGITLDAERDVWTLTSDLSMRMRPVPAPARMEATNTVLRQGRRSGTCRVEVHAADGAPVATGTVGFVKVPRRATDPPKPHVTPARVAALFDGLPALDRPLREEAGIEVVDADNGVVEVAVTPALLNPAGTLQGAMVALVAEAAAEDLATARSGRPAVVTDLDIRYLAQTRAGPIRTTTRLLGDRPDAPIEVMLVDLDAERLTTHVYARAVPVP